VPEGPDADGVLDHAHAPLEIVCRLPAPHPELEAMPVAVEGHNMAACVNPGRQLGALLDLLADQEEDRLEAGLAEELEHRRGPLGMRSVIEAENDAVSASEPPGKTQGVGGVQDHGSKHPEHGGPTETQRMIDRRELQSELSRPRGGVGSTPLVERGIAMSASPPELDPWLADPAVRVTHRRSSYAGAEELWDAARELRLSEARMLGRLVRWRIPGTPATTTVEGLFRNKPFAVLDEGEHALVSGLVGRIWTLRRDYPAIEDPEEFREWSKSGTAKVLFAHWVESTGDGRTNLSSEARVQAFGVQGRIGLASVRPLIRSFQHLIATDAIAPAVRRADAR
jgi:hypothetical protein